MKKILALFFILFSLGVGATVSAQSSLAPLNVSISSLTVSTTTSEILLNYSVTNNRSVFADNLEYRLEMYRGDKLADEGNLFGSLEYVFNQTGLVNKIAPNEKIEESLKFIPASSVKAGNYFARFVVFDREYKNVGIDYTKSPIALKGSGSFLGQIEATFKTSKGDDFLMAGQLIDKAETPAIVISLDKNATLKKALDSGLKYTIEAKVFSLESDKPVYEYQPMPLVVSGNIVKIDLKPWSGIKPFPYQVEVLIKNSKGEVVANKIVARWWVQGFMARIGDVKTQTNFYNKNQKVDLNVETIAFQWTAGQQGVVEAVFEKSDGRVASFSQDVMLSELSSVDFSEFKMPEKTMIKSLTLNFKDKTNGEIFESKKIEMTQDKVYSQSNKLADILTWSGIILGMIALILLAIYVKNKRKVNLVLGAIFLILSVVVLVLVSLFDVTKVFADKGQTVSTVWFSVQPSGSQGTCPATAVIEITGTAFCSTCRNGVEYTGEIRMAGRSLASIYQGDLGHIWEYTTFGPYRVTAPLTTNHDWYEATMVTSEGYHCLASSAVVTGPAVWCTVPNGGVCNPAYDGKVLSNLSSTDPNLCSDGLAWNFQGTGPWTWTCRGEGGLHDYCSATKTISSGTTASCGWSDYSISSSSFSTASAITIPCNVGTDSTPVLSGPNWVWTCTQGSSVASCSAPVLYGTCGSARGVATSTIPTINLCGTGSVKTQDAILRQDNNWWWKCNLPSPNLAPSDTSCSAPNTGLSATCLVTPTYGKAPLNVTWSVNDVTGGVAPYSYSWIFSNTPFAAGNVTSVTRSYDSGGSYYYATTTVRDSTGNSIAVGCSGRVGSYDSGGGNRTSRCTTPVCGTGIYINPDDETVLPSIACSVFKVTPDTNNAVINTHTRWEVRPPQGGIKTWTIDGGADSTTTATTTNILDKIFTTIGKKTVSVSVNSSDPLVSGVCSGTASTTVVQKGGTTEI